MLDKIIQFTDILCTVIELNVVLGPFHDFLRVVNTKFVFTKIDTRRDR